jgi:hypothetical protein
LSVRTGRGGARRYLSVATRPSYNTGTGFFVSDGLIYDANGHAFVMKGPNMNHAWGSYNSNYAAIDQIARTGANAVRTVMYQDIQADPSHFWTDSADTPARRKAVVERYLANGMVAVVEDHASIQDGSSQSSTAALHEIVTHWLDNAAWLKQYEAGVILNIANEWGPPANTNGSNTVWRDTYIQQVLRLRRGPDGTLGNADDVTNLIMIDAGQWGQDFNTLALHAQQVLDADPQKNIVFSIHLYGQWRDESRAWEVSSINSNFGPWDIRSRLGSLVNRPARLPLVIGEWAWEDFRDFSNSSAPYAGYRTQRVMEIAHELGIGWLGWSYNGSSPTTLNMIAGNINNSTYGNNTHLTAWGDAVVNHPVHGTKASARRATVFPFANLPAAPAGLPAMPASMPSDLHILLDTTRPTIVEGAWARVDVRLSKQPAADVTINVARVAGDFDVVVETPSLTFTPDNWSTPQPVLYRAAQDGDTNTETARIQLASPGLQSVDFTARVIDASNPLGSATLNPVADRGWSGGATNATLSINSTTSPQPTGALFMRFDTRTLGGTVGSATLRVYKTTSSSNASVRLHGVLNDAWTESSTSGINTSIALGTRAVGNAANAYVEIDVTDWARQQHAADGLVSLALTTVSGSMTFQTREGANPPQLVLNMVEAIPPRVVGSAFDHTAAPQRITIDFSEDVQASLAGADVEVTGPDGLVGVGSVVGWDAATRRATFSFSPAELPDGDYRVTLRSAGVADAAGNALLVDHRFEFFHLRADLNRDRAVNFADLLILAQNYGQSGTYAQGDVDRDGTVGFGDLLILAQQFSVSLLLPERSTEPPRKRADDGRLIV